MMESYWSHCELDSVHLMNVGQRQAVAMRERLCSINVGLDFSKTKNVLPRNLTSDVDRLQSCGGPKSLV